MGTKVNGLKGDLWLQHGVLRYFCSLFPSSVWGTYHNEMKERFMQKYIHGGNIFKGNKNNNSVLREQNYFLIL